VAVDDQNSNRVWVAADLGVYESKDGGTTWQGFYNELPHAYVGDLLFHPSTRRLRAGTRNRGIWEVEVDPQSDTGLYVFPSSGSAPTQTWDSGEGNWTAPNGTYLVGDFTGDGRDQIAAIYQYPNDRTGLFVFPPEGTAPTQTWDSGEGNWTAPNGTYRVGDFTADGKDQIAAIYDE